MNLNQGKLEQLVLNLILTGEYRIFRDSEFRGYAKDLKRAINAMPANL